MSQTIHVVTKYVCTKINQQFDFNNFRYTLQYLAMLNIYQSNTNIYINQVHTKKG